MTFDTHLINEAMLALGMAAGIAILMALAITGIAATQLRRKTPGGKLTRLHQDAKSAREAREREPQAA